MGLSSSILELAGRLISRPLGSGHASPSRKVKVPLVSIRPMTETEFKAFLAQDIHEYAAEKVRAGNWTPDEALQRSCEAHDKLLPEGLATPNHHLFTIELDVQPVGRLWLSSDPKTSGGAGFIYDLYVAEPFRRKGIARRALLLLEQDAIRLGLTSLALHVFGHNTAARALYESLGYSITNVNMAKTLPAA